MAGSEALEKGGGRVEEQGMLFEYTVKLLLVAGFLELVLYRLISRLGMHLSKVAEKHESVRLTFKGLSSIGFTLLNFVSLLLFLAFFLLLFNKLRAVGVGRYDGLLIPSVSLLLVLTVAFLVFPPAMLGSVVYNVVTLAVLVILVFEYLRTHPSRVQRAMVSCYFLGVTGWLYYQILSTTYGLLGLAAVPPLVHEINRAGEAMMVGSSILVFWAYGGTPLWTKNRRQQRRAATFAFVGGGAFLALLFLDYFLGLYDPALAGSIRKAGEGIGWIFQMGMGYTFYLPFAFYVTGLLCWGYTVVKLVTLGRMAGFGLGLMFMAGYALQLSHLSLMVVLGLMLLNLDRRRPVAVLGEPGQASQLATTGSPILGEQT
ncbi:MAG: hypothetical protein E6K61_04695 [Nitrospirae bacterium]|nr:MAG: hypothetical protein E6K61_04695 [Nitrospirota bacterium]